MKRDFNLIRLMLLGNTSVSAIMEQLTALAATNVGIPGD
jgi:hypothetical protein